MRKKKVRYNIISPDGFSIHIMDTYSSPEEAWGAFDKWRERYEHQGYYSSPRYGRIPLNELKDYCHLTTE